MHDSELDQSVCFVDGKCTKPQTNVFKAVRRGVASDYRLTLRRLKREARRRLMNLIKT